MVYSISNQLARVESSTGASVQYGYDENDALKTVRATYDQVSKQMSYEYDADYNETKTTTMGGKTLTSEYDALGRVITKRLNTDNQFTVTYGYRDGANGSSSAMIQSVSNNGRLTSYLYYDDGNIRQIHTPWTAQAFEYDAIGQLIRVDDNDTGHTTVYSYDAGGNMTSEKVYSYTTEAEPATEVLSQRNFTYDTIWKDQMLTCGGKALTYDGVGNLLSYDGTTFTWTKGRRLSGVTKADGTAAAYTYNHNGQRASKTVGGVKHTYFYSGNLLNREKAGSLDMRFSYDSVGNPVSILYNDVEYYYVKNLQGDIIGLIDTAGTWVVEYSYDVWGNIRNIFGSMASTLGQDNPIRYRGYYYDNETKLYYVLSRYYSPELCRFISADALEPFVRDHENSVQYNLYVYCWNNPVNMFDGYGDWPEWVKKAVAVVAVTAVVVALVTVAVAGTLSTVVGAIGASASVVAQVKSGAYAGGVIAGGVNMFMQGVMKGPENINPGEAANSAFFGSLSGGISAGIAGGYPDVKTATATQLLVHNCLQMGANLCIANGIYAIQTSTLGSDMDLYGYTIANMAGGIAGISVALAGKPAVALAIGLEVAGYGSALVEYIYKRLKRK